MVAVLPRSVGGLQFPALGRLLGYDPNLSTWLAWRNDLHALCSGGSRQELERRGSGCDYSGHRSRLGNARDGCCAGFWVWWGLRNSGRHARLLGATVAFVDASNCTYPAFPLFGSALWASVFVSLWDSMRALRPVSPWCRAYVFARKLVTRCFWTVVCFGFGSPQEDPVAFNPWNSRVVATRHVGSGCYKCGRPLLQSRRSLWPGSGVLLCDWFAALCHSSVSGGGCGQLSVL